MPASYRRVLYLTSAIVFVDTLFFAALTPLLPHYAHELGLGKAGAGVLAAAYPLGTLVGAIPSGFVAARFGVKPTVLVGLVGVAVTTALFGVVDAEWQLDLARFLQGLASSFSWTGSLAWLVASAPEGAKGKLIGQAFAAAVAGALFGPVLGGAATLAGTGADLRRGRGRVSRARRRRVPHPGAPPGRRRSRSGCSRLRSATGASCSRCGSSCCRRSSSACSGSSGRSGSLRSASARSGSARSGSPPAPSRRSTTSSSAASRTVSARSCRSGRRSSSHRRHDRPPVARERVRARPRDPRGRARVRHLLYPGDGASDRGGRGPRARLRVRVRAAQPRLGAGADGGSALGGTIAEATSDAVPYLILSGLALVTLLALRRSRAASESRLVEQAR